MSPEPLHVNTPALGAVAFKTYFKGNNALAALDSPSFADVAGDIQGLAVLQTALTGAQQRWDAASQRVGGELENFASVLVQIAQKIGVTDEDAGNDIATVVVA